MGPEASDTIPVMIDATQPDPAADLLPRITLRAEMPEDDAFLRRLNIAVRWNEFAQTGLPAAQIIKLLEQQYEARNTHYRHYFAAAEFNVILRGGTPIGRFTILRDPDAYRLIDIAILPDQSGKGVGGQLIDRLIADAQAARVPVTLQVDPFNRARALYQRKGFVDLETSDSDVVMILYCEISADIIP